MVVEYFSRAWLDQVEQQTEESSFAGPVITDQSKALSFWYIEVVQI
jgi:hypothetical protein